jgi:hypothetical protein
MNNSVNTAVLGAARNPGKLFPVVAKVFPINWGDETVDECI